jgi:hypothetical protein
MRSAGVSGLSRRRTRPRRRPRAGASGRIDSAPERTSSRTATAGLSAAREKPPWRAISRRVRTCAGLSSTIQKYFSSSA